MNIIPTSLKLGSLAYSLYGAALAVTDVCNGIALPATLKHIFILNYNISPQIRGAIQDLSYFTVRKLGCTSNLISLLIKNKKSLQPKILNSLLCCALSLLLDEKKLMYSIFTVVDQAVEAAVAEIFYAKSIVNAILRRFLRERNVLLYEVQKTLIGVWNYPVWWINCLEIAYPNQWQAILLAGNTLPPLSLRVNQRKIDVTSFLQILIKEGITAKIIGQNAICLDKPVPVMKIPGFAEGLVSVQDVAAQLAAPLLDVQNGMYVLDACAAPGGKTGHLLECADIDLLALDQNIERLYLIKNNLQRLGLKAKLKVGDARYGLTYSNLQEKQWWDGIFFDRILVDVPCTASGIVRRHPDIRWLRRQTDTLKLAGLAKQILFNLWQMLKPNGKLLLVTCSLWPEESEELAVNFVKNNTTIRRLPAPGQLLPSTDADKNHDGLFYALFQKIE